MPQSSASTRLERLPQLVDRKIYKTGQTRGATKSEIYQNRVGRASTVLITYDLFDKVKTPDDGSKAYEAGSITLVKPDWYFEDDQADAKLKEKGLILGANALLLFERRHDWVKYGVGRTHLPNGMPFEPAEARNAPLGGVYMARVHSTTAQEDGGEVFRGFNTTANRGAGVRVYEYASESSLGATRLQLEALIWLCHDAVPALITGGMTQNGAEQRSAKVLADATAQGLLDYQRLQGARMIDDGHNTICPLCLQRLSAVDFFKRSEQAEGRETYDITTTEISLFHIEELRVGKLQHKIYNLGWGHHFCNVVVKDAGIIPTLKWMKMVIDNNGGSYEAIAKEEASVEEAVEQ